MPNQHKRAPLSFRPAADLRDRLEAFTAETGRSAGAVLSEALTAFLNGPTAAADRLPRPKARPADVAEPELKPAITASRGMLILDGGTAAERDQAAAEWVAEPGELAAAVDAVTVCVCQHQRSGHRNDRGACGVGSCMCSRYRRRRG